MPAPQTPTKTIVLHIGRHKTGTSSIQATLKHNHAVLWQRGVLFPGFLPVNHSGFFISAFMDSPENRSGNSRRGLNRAEIETRTKRHLEDLGRALTQFRGTMIILSGENACNLKPHEAARLLARLTQLADAAGVRLDYRVLFYTRDPVTYASSALQQHIKKNRARPQDRKRYLMDKAVDRYRQIHATWAGVFGADAVTFRSFESACAASGGLIRDFLATLGLSPEGIEPRRANDSISDEVAGFLASPHAPQRAPDEVESWSAGVDLKPRDRDILFALRGSKGGLLTPAEQLEIWEAAETDRQFLQEQFGISYPRPDPDSIPLSESFGPAFLDDLAAALPNLSLPVRSGLLRYLLTHPAPAGRQGGGAGV